MLLYTVLLSLLATVIVAVPPVQVPLQQKHPSKTISISSDWDILGPFQIGTREATWGADPLEQFGGFRSRSPSINATFHSSLTTNGTVHWSTVRVKPVSDADGGVKVDLHVAFPEVDWPFLQSIYGWAALQWQAWARSTINVKSNSSQTYLLHIGGILEFWLDGESYFGGDYYSFRKAPVVLTLTPGEHQLDVRLLRDVRVMGGVGEPVIDVVLELLPAEKNIDIQEQHLLISDVVDGVLASPWASIPIRNTGQDDLTITGIVSDKVDSSDGDKSLRHAELQKLAAVEASLSSSTPIVIRPGQTRPISFGLYCRRDCPDSVSLTLHYRLGTLGKCYHLQHQLNHKSVQDVHKFTFQHPAGIISYAMLRAPPANSTSRGSEKLPILLNLHGAGLEAADPQLTTSLDPVGDLPAYTLFPTGGTPWSGDDWHQWGWADVDAAMDALTLWRGAETQVDTTNWLVVGHSNGGQGVWHALTHHPDNVIAAVPVAGYLSIQKYVPYSLWHEADPGRMSVVQASLASYRHELLISNAKDIPLMQEHGAVDDNVPAYHSRRMAQLINESGWHSEYNEVPGENHWFSGIMATMPLQQFYRRMLNKHARLAVEDIDMTLTVANPGDTGSKHGFSIEHLIDPGRLGKLNVQRQLDTLILTTSNVEQLVLPKHVLTRYEALKIDAHSIDASLLGMESSLTLRWDPQIQWHAVKSSLQQDIPVRHGNQLGRLDAILRTQGRLTIRSNGAPSRRLALQIARNLYQYFGADAEILAEIDSTSSGNVISIIEGEDVISGNHPISILNGTIRLRDDASNMRSFPATDTSVIFLKPFEKNRLELVMWGDQKSSLARAGRMLPMLPGVGQPEFIVMSSDCSWNGIEGVLAMGFFDRTWNVSRSSFVT